MRVNNRIRVPEVRVVLEDGEQKGIMPTRQAQALAKEMGLDLVEISPRSHPPVCRIMDYGKFKYEQAKKKKAAKQNSSTVELKEIKFRPKTEGHDMDFKIKHVRRFIEDGNKCRLVITFRGREITHPGTGRAVLDKVVRATEDIANVEVNPNMEGRRMVMILAPRSSVLRKARQPREDNKVVSQAPLVRSKNRQADSAEAKKKANEQSDEQAPPTKQADDSSQPSPDPSPPTGDS